MRTPFHAARSLALGIAVALIAAGCSVGAEDAADAEDATIGFVAPSDGSSVSIPFDVELEASEALDEPSTGNRHAHIYFDTGTDAADYDIVYGTAWEVTRELAPGDHTLTVALANPDHSLAGPTEEITVTVEEGGADPEAGGESSPASTPPPTIDY
jgi:hypothetical protein